MPGWVIPSGPSNKEFLARLEAIQRSIDDGTDRQVARQHLVSKSLLKFFAAPIPGKSGNFLVPHHIQHGPRSPLGTTGCAYKMRFLEGASESAEKLWQATVEDKLDEAVRAARNKRLYENEERVRVLKHTIALHYVRSLHWRVTHDWAVSHSADAIRTKLLESRGGLADSAFYGRYGLIAAGEESRRLAIDPAFENWERCRRSGALARTSIEFRFKQFCEMFEAQPLQVGHTPPDHFLLVSDSPCISVQYSKTGGPHLLRVAVGDANTVVLPIAPDCILAIGGMANHFDLTPENVMFLNESQVRVAHEYIYYAPGSPLRETAARLIATVHQ